MNNIQNYGSIAANTNCKKNVQSPSFKAKLDFSNLRTRYAVVDYKGIADIFEKKTQDLLGSVGVWDESIAANATNNALKQSCAIWLNKKAFGRFLLDNNNETIADTFIDFLNIAKKQQQTNFKIKDYDALAENPIIKMFIIPR